MVWSEAWRCCPTSTGCCPSRTLCSLSRTSWQLTSFVVTGDHAAGPQPVPVLDRLTGLGDRAVLGRGNADRELAALARGDTSAVREVYDIDAWAAAQLTAAHTQLLAEMPHPVTLDVDGFGPVLFCHGTPRDDEEVVGGDEADSASVAGKAFTPAVSVLPHPVAIGCRASRRKSVTAPETVRCGVSFDGSSELSLATGPRS